MSDPADPQPPDARRRPASAWQMAWVFNRLALQGFGGVLPVAQRELVERERWLGKDEFLALLSLGQVLPGPNIVNMALIIGQRFHGLRGAAASLAGLLLVPLAIVLALAVLASQFDQHPRVSGALRGMGVVASGLVLATAIKLTSPLRRSVLGLPTALLLGLATFVAIGVLRWPLVGVVLALGTTGFALAWWRLGSGKA
jgi:chromate transporter